MWYQYLIIPAMVVTIYCHTPKNNSDVIVTYSGHHEANIASVPNSEPKILIPETLMSNYPDTTTQYREETDSVVFIPDEKPIFRNDEIVPDDRMSVGDIFNRGKIIGDIMNNQQIRVETETPKQDILFISGKNGENENTDQKVRKDPKPETKRSGKERTRKVVLNCSNLECNNTLDSVCGGKMEHKKWRYRLFLNECFFRKVNCNFIYEENRFKAVPVEKCKPIAAHYSERPIVYQPLPPMKVAQTSTQRPDSRRSFSFRRSLNLDVNGKSCSHPCPISCSEQYEPECAMSSQGIRRVFINHCKLDYNSCSQGSVWYRRPLAECVGGRKADMTRNSAFIGWMQRVGIVDNKGRLTLE